MGSTFTENTLEQVAEFLNEDVDEFRERDQKLCCDNFDDEDGNKLSVNFGPGTMGEHEALHMAHVANCIVEDYVVKHPAVVLNKRAYEMASLASWLLAEVYQAIACDSEKALAEKRKFQDAADEAGVG